MSTMQNSIFIVESAAVCVALLILSLCGSHIVGNEENNYLSLENTLPLRGLLAAFIMLHHASGYLTQISFLAPFRHIGYLVVALFFFLSGYGLMCGLETKAKYMDGFLKKRMTSILIPYWVGNTVHFGLSLLMGWQIGFAEYLRSMLLLKMINGSMWYVQVLVLLYILFYVSSFRKKDQKLFCLLFSLYYVGALILGIDGLYTQSTLAFPLGMAWYINKERINHALGVHYWFGLSLAVAATALGFGLKIAGTLCGSSIITQCGNTVSAVAFCILAMWLIKRIRISNSILHDLGTISYEVYLNHIVVLNTLWRVSEIRNHPLVFAACSFGIVYILAKCLNRADRLIIERLSKSYMNNCG